MGETVPFEDLAEFTSDRTGYCRGNIYGSYVHGLFDEKDIAKGIIELVSGRRGRSVNTDGILDQAQFKEKQYDLLADCLRENLDMDKIYDIMSVKKR